MTKEKHRIFTFSDGTTELRCGADKGAAVPCGLVVVDSEDPDETERERGCLIVADPAAGTALYPKKHPSPAGDGSGMSVFAFWYSASTDYAASKCETEWSGATLTKFTVTQSDADPPSAGTAGVMGEGWYRGGTGGPNGAARDLEYWYQPGVEPRKAWSCPSGLMELKAHGPAELTERSRTFGEFIGVCGSPTLRQVTVVRE